MILSTHGIIFLRVVAQPSFFDLYSIDPSIALTRGYVRITPGTYERKFLKTFQHARVLAQLTVHVRITVRRLTLCRISTVFII